MEYSTSKKALRQAIRDIKGIKRALTPNTKPTKIYIQYYLLSDAVELISKVEGE